MNPWRYTKGWDRVTAATNMLIKAAMWLLLLALFAYGILALAAWFDMLSEIPYP